MGTVKSLAFTCADKEHGDRKGEAEGWARQSVAAPSLPNRWLECGEVTTLCCLVVLVSNAAEEGQVTRLVILCGNSDDPQQGYPAICFQRSNHTAMSEKKKKKCFYFPLAAHVTHTCSGREGGLSCPHNAHMRPWFLHRECTHGTVTELS